MSVDVAPAPRPTPVPPSPAPKAGLGLTSYVLIGLLGFALPIMRHVAFGGARVNACAGDLFLLPVLLVLRSRWVRSGPLGYWIFALWMVNLVSWAWSISVLTFDVFIREAMKLTTCYLYAFVGLGIGREAASEKAFIRGSTFVVVPMAAIAIFAFFTRTPSFFIVESRVAGTLTDPNAFGVYLGMMLPLLASLRIGWVAIPLFIGAAVVSFSRTGLVAVSASLALSLANLGLRRYLIVVLVCAVVFVGVWGIASSTTTGKRVTNYQDTLETRQGLWAAAAEVAAEHPFIGIGKGNWYAVTGRNTLPHNTFLSIMVDGGLFGFAIFMIPLTVWLWRGIRTPRARPWAIALFVGLVGGLAVSFDNFRPFWVAVGVLVAVLLRSREGTPRAVCERARQWHVSRLD